MEKNRKYWVSYDRLWKLDINWNIPSFEHSATFANIAHSHLFHTVVTWECREEQNCLHGKLYQTDRFQHKSKNSDERGSGREMIAAIPGKSAMFVQMILLTTKEGGGGVREGPALPSSRISMFKKQKEVFSGGCVSRSYQKASKMLFLWMFLTS